MVQGNQLIVHLLVTIKVFHTLMLLIKKLQRKKINGVPRTMGFTALPCILLSRSCWTSRMFMAYWDSILAPPGRQASWETEVLSYKIFMVSKNQHSRVLFHLQPERNLDLGSKGTKCSISQLHLIIHFYNFFHLSGWFRDNIQVRKTITFSRLQLVI